MLSTGEFFDGLKLMSVTGVVLIVWSLVVVEAPVVQTALVVFFVVVPARTVRVAVLAGY